MNTVHGIGYAAIFALVASAAPAQDTGQKSKAADSQKAKSGAENQVQNKGTGRTFGFEQAGALPNQPKPAKDTSAKSVDPSKAAAEAKAAPAAVKWTLFEATKEVALRDFQSINGNVVAGPFPAGTLFLAKDSDATSASFLRVSVPGGFPGYIFAKFLRETDRGTGIVTGDRVSFRYRPRPKNGEAPVDAIGDGVEVKLLERSGDWWRVLSSPEIRAWAASDALREVKKIEAMPDAIVAALDDATKTRYEGQVAKQSEAWNAAREQLAKARELAEATATIDGLIADAVALTDQESAKEFSEQSWKPVGELYATIEKQLKEKGIEDGPTHKRFTVANAEFRRRELLCGIKTAKAQPKPVATNVKPLSAEPEPKRFEYSGWLEYRPGPHDYSPFQLYKGGQRLYFVVCDSGRYELADYRGLELGISGTVERREGASIRVLNIEKLLVIGRK